MSRRLEQERKLLDQALDLVKKYSPLVRPYARVLRKIMKTNPELIEIMGDVREYLTEMDGINKKLATYGHPTIDPLSTVLLREGKEEKKSTYKGVYPRYEDLPKIPENVAERIATQIGSGVSTLMKRFEQRKERLLKKSPSEALHMNMTMYSILNLLAEHNGMTAEEIRDNLKPLKGKSRKYHMATIKRRLHTAEKIGIIIEQNGKYEIRKDFISESE